MNNQYISFWQNALNDALNPDKQMATFNNLFNHTISQFGDISSSFKKLAEGKPAATTEEFFNLFTLSSTDYQKSFNEYLKLFGFVSIDEYRSLIQKYEKLKKEKQGTQQADKAQNDTIKAQKEELSKQKKQIATQKASLTKAKKEMADLKKELAKNQVTETPKAPAKEAKKTEKK